MIIHKKELKKNLFSSKPDAVIASSEMIYETTSPPYVGQHSFELLRGYTDSILLRLYLSSYVPLLLMTDTRTWSTFLNKKELRVDWF